MRWFVAGMAAILFHAMPASPCRGQAPHSVAPPAEEIARFDNYIKHLKSPDPFARLLGAVGLGTEEAKSAVRPLMVALKDPIPDVRFEVARSLGKIGPAARESAVALCGALNDESAPVRYAAADALGLIEASSEVAVAPLRKALDDVDPLVNVAAATSLALIDPGSQKVALEALATSLETCLYDPDSLPPIYVYTGLERLGPKARSLEKPVIATLKSGRPDDRELALLALRAMGCDSDAFVSVLIGILQDKREIDLVEPLGQLAWLYLEPLIRGRTERYPNPRYWLEIIGSRCHTTRICRRLAVDTLGELGPKARAAIPALQRAASDEDAIIRLRAASALRQVRGDS